MARGRQVGIIGPATVGGITPGSFRIGNTGGAIENLPRVGDENHDLRIEGDKPKGVKRRGTPEITSIPKPEPEAAPGIPPNTPTARPY